MSRLMLPLRSAIQLKVIPCLNELIVKCTQTFGNNPRRADHRHKIMVTRPSRDDVQMKMIRHPRTSTSTQIQADVKPLRVNYRAQQFLRVFGEQHEFQLFVRREGTEFGGFAVGNSHEVTNRVRIPVHDEVSAFASQDDEMGRVVGGPRRFAKKIR